jgi:hypothetical protein
VKRFRLIYAQTIVGEGVLSSEGRVVVFHTKNPVMTIGSSFYRSMDELHLIYPYLDVGWVD